MSRSTAPVTALLAAACVAGYGIELASGDVEQFCGSYGLAHFTLGAALGSLFLHAGLLHLAGNLAMLIVFGSMVERAIGSLRFAVVFFAAGVAGAVAHTLLDPSTTLVGASGAILGVMAVCAMVRPRTVGFTAIYFAWNLCALFFPQSAFAMPGVSLGCHVGGFVAGFLVGRALFGRALAEAAT